MASKTFGKVLNYKLVLLGDAAVGKSSCVERFVKNEFFEYETPTIGAAFITQSVQVDDYTIRFEIWDTAGQERYRSLAPIYYRAAAAALVVYDVTDYQTFVGAKNWIEELHRQASPDIVIGIAGNKVDLAETSRRVPQQEAAQFAEENGCLFCETSAKTGQNVREIIMSIARLLPKGVQSTETDYVKPEEGGSFASKCCW
eukprot:TRINITY_DN694_c0_g1_i9.p1 TRINITY_DN694_c0_g1~~TRINITY_DN694_c0_g1_i9.p1  ORF type:complete len:200 (+),score=38.12 TRINITY_DN694_c0_g1_i9:85-684(+)